ncbi:Apolipophorin, partial [Papilio machaon]
DSLKDPYICGPPSCAASEKFKYLAQTVYYYNYNVNVETYFAGSSNNRSTLDVTAEVKVQFITPCEGLLQLQNITLTDQDENYAVERSEKFVQAVSQFDLRFAFHDGVISEICPNLLEEDWVLNFKRAILSLFQNSMKRFDINFNGFEQDIHGTCNVEYTVRGQENTSLILVKKRDLAQCTDRYKYMSILQTVRYDFQSKFQTWPVLKSESKCRISVDHNIYKSVNCRERHLFEPFSGKNSGAMSTVIQDLVLVKELNRTDIEIMESQPKERHLFEPFSGNNSGAMSTVIQDLVLIKELNRTDIEIMESQPKAWSMIQKRSNILHYHVPMNRGDTGELRSARDVLKLLCLVKQTPDGEESSVDENMDSGSIVGLWGRLVRSARKLHHPALAQLLARAPAICPAASKHILDALPYIASTGSVELIKDKVINEDVDKETRHEWLMSMAMIPRPRIEMLKSMLELLQKQRNDKIVSFTVSSMLHSYCRHSGKSLRECCEEEIPKQILEEFQNIVMEVIGKGLPDAEREDRNKVTYAIKALGNIGGFKSEFADVLMNVIGDALVPVPVRLTAIDAFRRTPCTETREYFLETFREELVDIEVRIASYLQVMRCPDLNIIRRIFHALKIEPVNQAVTFVWSHLNNLGQSSLPSRVEIQGLLTGNTMPRLDDSPDFRMYSRNYEQSIFFDQYNAGGNYEANVVFSPDSYIPRSLSLNLTVDMFGESINLLEIKARGEGFEKYFEAFFGKNGPWSKTEITDKINKIRIMRSTNEAEDLKEKVEGLGYKNNALKHRYPMAELGLKVFGNEISFWSAEGPDEIVKSLEKLNPKLRVLEILSGKEIKYNKASLFLDTTFSVPTGSGLPLNMNLMGTSYVDTKMSGTVVDRFEQAGNLDFAGMIRPSVAVNIAATMGVVAGALSSSAVRLSARLYTATALEAKLSLRGLNVGRLDLSLPRDKQEIFAAKSELVILHGERELQQPGLNRNRIARSTCSWTTVDRAIGIKLCAAYQFPNMTNLHNAPYFLMSGPAKYILSLEKADPSAKTYAFQYKWQKNDTANVVGFSFDTPDSKFPNMTNLHNAPYFLMSGPAKYILSLEKADPSAKTYAFQYKWQKNDTANVVGFSFDTPDSKEKRMIDASMIISNTSTSASLSLQSARSTLRARALYRNLPHDKSLQASLDVDGRKQFDTTMSITRHDIKYGYVWIPHAYWVVNNETIAELSGTVKVKTKGGVTQWDITTDFQTRQLASRLIGYYTLNGPTHGAKLQLDYEFYRNPKQTIRLEGVYSERVLGYRHDLYGELSMDFTAYPGYNFYTVLRNVKTQSHIDIGFNKTQSHIDIGFNKTQSHIDIGFNVSASRQQKLDPAFTATFKRIDKLSGVKLAAELAMTRPPRPILLKFNFEELNAVGIWFTGVDFNVDALYQDQSKTNLASHRVKLILNSSHFKDVLVDARFTQDNRQITFIGQGEYNSASYRALVRHVSVAEQRFSTYGEVDAAGRAYSLTLNADLNNNTDVSAHLHFDQLRDVEISYQRSSTELQKRLSASINWDANRDPSQKLSVDTGPKYSALAVLNFNPKSREIVLSGYVFAPAGSQLYVDAEANVTLPTLHPCTLRAKLHEKQPNEFQLNAVGIWFTGVDFNVDALYQDQSKTNLASHRVKLILNSSHFKDILVDARFTQDNRQITFIGQIDYARLIMERLVPCALRHHAVISSGGKPALHVAACNRAAEMKYLRSLTEVLLPLVLQPNETNNSLRDVEISYQRSSTELQKRLSASINWDANRDPSQKLSVDVQLDNKGRWHRAGHITLYYPGRVVNGEFDFLLKDWFCEWHVRMGWASDAIVLWRVKMYSEARQETVYALLSSLDTPFSGWQDTTFNVMWRYQDNLQALNGSMKWQEDYLAFNLLADYMFKANEFYGELSALVNSTIPTLPRAAAIARHRAVWKKSADTLLSFQYNDEGKLMINSSWNLERGEKENNITGRITLVTPFQGYTSGFLRTEFVLGHKRDIKGITYLDLEEKVVKIYVDGHMRRITNCMLVVNVTSPASEMSRMAARFGFVERDRHLVAMVVTPNSTTGIEILLKLVTMQDFHVFGHIALPIQYLNRAMLTAKRAPQEVTVTWDSVRAGFKKIDTNEFYGELSALVNSTIPTLPRAAAIARHRAVWKKSADTLLSFQYNDEGKLMINSSWNLERGEKENNITGRITLVTPFQGYTSGFLRTEFVLGHKRDIKGITYLDLEEKVVKIYVDGHMRRITNCMLVVNVTSPASEMSRMAARFGFVERDRHLVAIVVTPNSTTGIEILLKLVTMQDFHVFGHIALPIQYLNRAMLTAKRAPQEVSTRQILAFKYYLK